PASDSVSLRCSLPQFPPCSPPFPYTTLFRSRLRTGPTAAHPERRGRTSTPADRAGCPAPYRALVGPPPSHRGSPPLRCDRVVRPDRKSTRLNSSHQIISYAVFRLKKKNDRHG